MGTILLIILILLLVGALPTWPLQLGLGLLPERWSGAYFTRIDPTARYGTHMTSHFALLTRR